MAWVRSIGTVSPASIGREAGGSVGVPVHVDKLTETGATVAPWARDSSTYLTPHGALRRLSAFSAETIALLKAQEEAKSGRTATVPPARVNLILCHNNAILQRFQEAGTPGHYEHRSSFQNAFVTGHRGIADLREAKFAPDDDSEYCMTYGRCFKILSQIHDDLAHRATQGQPLHGARICIATHITLLDSWHPTTDLAMLLYLIWTLRSYGCALPRLVHLSQGPCLSIATGQDGSSTGIGPAPVFNQPDTPGLAPVQPYISLHWNGDRHQRGHQDMIAVADDIKHTINAASTHLQGIAERTDLTASYVGAETGFIHIIVPDSKTAAQIRRDSGDALIRRGWIFEGAQTDDRQSWNTAGPRANSALTIRFTLYAQLPQAKFPIPDHMIILPFQRQHQAYARLGPAQICAVISMVGTYFNTAALPLRVAIVSHAPPEADSWLKKDPYALLRENPIDPNARARQHIAALPLFEKTKYVCRLAEASIQPGRLFPEATVVASERGLVRVSLTPAHAVGRAEGPEVVRLTAAGVFASRANLPPAVAKFIDSWQRTPYPPFAAYCLAALLERSVTQAAPLLSADPETLARIAKDSGYADPLTHMLSPIVDYVRKYGVTLIGDGEMRDFAALYGADPTVLAEVVIRIISLRHAGISSNVAYGPFQPEVLIKILREQHIFPVAEFAAGNDRTTYSIPGSKTLHVIPQDSPYPVHPAVLILHFEEERVTGPYVRNALPTAIIRIHANVSQ
jgi:hypothetical protein